MVSRKDLAISYNAAPDAAGRPLMTPKAFCAAVRRLRPTLKDGQRTMGGEVKDVFLGLSLPSHTPSTTGQESAHSVHSGLFPQISLQGQREEGERVKSIKMGNELNGLNELNERIGGMDPCFCCKGGVFWESIYGSVVCAECHPPINDSLVKQWIGGRG